MILLGRGGRRPPLLNEMRDCILAACPGSVPIVLFGARARGDAAADSDFDLLVVAPSDEPANARAVPLRLALWDDPSGFDILVLTLEELDAMKGFRSGVVHRALAKGVVLHEAACKTKGRKVVAASELMPEVGSGAMGGRLTTYAAAGLEVLET